jgi:hypothetical protein
MNEFELNPTSEDWRFGGRTADDDFLVVDAQDMLIARIYNHDADVSEWAVDNTKLVLTAKKMYHLLIRSLGYLNGCGGLPPEGESLETELFEFLRDLKDWDFEEEEEM